VKVWESVRKMKGLRRLYVEFEVPVVWRGFWGREGNERGLVKSLEGLGQGMERCVVGLPWEEEGRRGRGGESVQGGVGVEREGEIGIVRVNGTSERDWTGKNSFALESTVIWRREKSFGLSYR
jgi:hypothetical protein